jgi:hypothetical protein
LSQVGIDIILKINYPVYASFQINEQVIDLGRIHNPLVFPQHPPNGAGFPQKHHNAY